MFYVIFKLKLELIRTYLSQMYNIVIVYEKETSVPLVLHALNVYLVLVTMDAAQVGLWNSLYNLT